MTTPSKAEIWDAWVRLVTPFIRSRANVVDLNIITDFIKSAATNQPTCVTVDEWRPIDTLKHSPMGGYVLLTVGHGSMFIGLRNVYGDVVCTEMGKDGRASKCGATHWMPLPNPPQMEE